jgi:hypothetical protein
MWFEGDQVVIGYWPDLDGPELRAAVKLTGDAVILLSLEHADAPGDRRIRTIAFRAPGEPLATWLGQERKLNRSDQVSGNGL